jgi:hypothetical protein
LNLPLALAAPAALDLGETLALVGALDEAAMSVARGWGGMVGVPDVVLEPPAASPTRVSELLSSGFILLLARVFNVDQQLSAYAGMPGTGLIWAT